jgi:Flp pilus assembly protein TadB
MTMEPGGTGRMALSLTVLVVLAVAVWLTMEPGKYQQFTWLLLGFFALRVVLGWQRSRRMGYDASIRHRDRLDV